jgi:hypothetical protein
VNRGGKRVKQRRSDRRVPGEHKPPHTTIPTHSPLVISRYLWNRGSDRLTEPHTTTCSPSAARNRTTEARFGIVLPNPSPPRVFETHHPIAATTSCAPHTTSPIHHPPPFPTAHPKPSPPRLHFGFLATNHSPSRAACLSTPTTAISPSPTFDRSPPSKYKPPALCTHRNRATANRFRIFGPNPLSPSRC